MSWILYETNRSSPASFKEKISSPTHPANFIGPKANLRGRKVEPNSPVDRPSFVDLLPEKEVNSETTSLQHRLLKKAFKLVKNRSIIWYPAPSPKNETQFQTRIDSSYRKRYWHPDSGFVEDLFKEKKEVTGMDFMRVERFFIKWLQESSEDDSVALFKTLKTDLSLLSCVDFIFSCLYIEGILSKEKIQQIYIEQCQRLNQKESNALNCYGFAFKDGSDLSEGKAGDIVFMLGPSDEFHFFFLYKKEDERWLGISLFNQPEINTNDAVCSCQTQVIYVDDFMASLPTFKGRLFPLESFLSS